MNFTQPVWLALLLVPIGLAVAYVWAYIHPRNTIEVKPGLPDNRVDNKNVWWLHTAVACLVLVMLALALVVARPMINSTVAENRNTVMVTLDVSSSMDATDVAPSRLEAAKAAVAKAVTAAPASLNIGLVTLADNAQLVAAPSRDHTELLAKVAAIKSQPGGTASGEGVFAAVNALNLVRTFGGEASSFSGRIILVSDGVEEIKTGERNLDAAVADIKAKDLGYTILGVSYGTENGSLNGQPIQTDVNSLEAAAVATGGTLYSAGTADELQTALDSIANGSNLQSTSQTVPELIAWGALVLFMLIGVGLFLGFIFEEIRVTTK